MEHHVDAVDRTRPERPAVAAPAAEEVAVEVVDIGGRQLLDGDVAEIGGEVAVDDRAGLGGGGRGPVGRGGGEPALQKLGHRAAPEPGVGDLGGQFGQALAGVALAAVHRGGRPPGPAGAVNAR